MTKTSTDTEAGSETPITVSGVTIGTAEGGDLELDAEKSMHAPGGIQLTGTGAAFGPLEISAYPGSNARVGGLQFIKEQSLFDSLFGGNGGSSLFGSLAAFGAVDPDDEDFDVSRREVIKAAGLGLGGATVTSGVASAATETKSRKAQFEAIANPAGLRIRVFDRVEGYLPTDSAYYTFVNGEQYGRFAPASDDGYGDVLPQKIGTVTVGPSGSKGLLDSIRSDKTIKYDSIGLSKSTTKAQAGEEIVISTNDILVEATKSAGESGTTASINGSSIPHRNETTSSERGYYGVSDDRLVFVAGSNPPAGTTVSLTLYSGRINENVDDILRRVS